MQLTVTGVKSFRGTEGLGFNANLLANGKKVAFVIDEANGGDYHYEWVSDEAEKSVEAYIASLPATPLKASAEDWERKLYPNGREANFDCIVGELVDDAENLQRFIRQSKTKTLSRKDNSGNYYAHASVLTAALLSTIQKTSPNAEIFDAKVARWISAKDAKPVNDDVAKAVDVARLLASYRKASKTKTIFRTIENRERVMNLKAIDPALAAKFFNDRYKGEVEVFNPLSGQFVPLQKSATQPLETANAY